LGSELNAPSSSVPKAAVTVARSSKRGVRKTAAQGSIKKNKTVKVAAPKKAGKQIQGATLVDDDEPNDDSLDSEDEDPEASIETGTNSVAPLTSVPKSAVKVARNSKRGVRKTAAKVPTTQKRKIADAAPSKKKAVKEEGTRQKTEHQEHDVDAVCP
jgi:molecular chaperone DnaK (HSP70)